MALCEHCGQRIRWEIHAYGWRIPISPRPDPDGTVSLSDWGKAHVLWGVGLHVARKHRAVLYLNHRKLCPGRVED